MKMYARNGRALIQRGFGQLVEDFLILGFEGGSHKVLLLGLSTYEK